MQSLRSFSTTAARHLVKNTKSRPPPKKGQKQNYNKKGKPGDSKEAGSATASSAFASQVAASKQSFKLNAAAPKLPLKPTSPSAFTEENIGTVFETPAPIVTQLYALNALEKLAGYNYFSQVASVLRQPSVELAQLVLKDGSSQNRRVLLDGPAGSGKSTTLVQAMTLALQNKWVVISIPQAEALVNGTYAYAYSERRKSWLQDTYMAEMLGRIAEGNKEILKLQNTSKGLSFSRHSVPAKASLHKLLEVGANDPAVAFAVFDAFLAEMELEGRPSVLFAMEGFTIATLPTRYRNPDFEQIHPFDLEVIKNFVSYLDGTKNFKNGMVIASTSHRPACVPKALKIALGQAEATPFEVVDDRIAPSLKDVKILRVEEYTHLEAKSVIQHYASAGILRGVKSIDVDDSFVRQRTMLGSALGREVFRSCLKAL